MGAGPARLAGAWLAVAAACLAGPVPASAGAAPAPDAPALAAPGPFAIGLASLTFVQPDQIDVLAASPGGAAPRRDRGLPIDVWYPARPGGAGAAVVYAGAFTGEDGRAVAFTAPGAAVRGAVPAAGRFPLVIMAHGYGGTPVAMSWLAEALASKGYVVAGPHFNDPPITDGAAFAEPLARRPLDITFVAGRAQALARSGQGALAAADPSRTVLIGYSMGGYGVLAAAGGALDPALAGLTHGALACCVVGGPRSAALRVADLKAVVAIAPASRFGAATAFGAEGLAGVTTPTLFIAGGEDQLVGYDPGVRGLFEAETGAPRWLLTFVGAGHAIGMNGAPASLRGRLWDLDWFEDPVWRKDRTIAIQIHFITAFLDFEAKGEAGKAAYLTVADPDSNRGVWPQTSGEAYDATSPGAAPITVWKGFKRGHAAGLRLEHRPPAGPR